MSFKEYSKWFVEAIECDKCGKKYLLGNIDGRRKGFLCNDNIDEERKDKPQYPIRPQAGYIDKEWFDNNNASQVLLLGQNPGGGYNNDDDLYSIYEEIVHASDKEEKIREGMYKQKGIKGQITKGYKPNYYVLEDIKEYLNNKVVFAYANQILCRTKPEAGGIRNRALFNDVYKKCFNTNIQPLIKKIHPKFIITLGWDKDSPFDAQLLKYFCHDFIKHVSVPHPSRRKIEALNQIKIFIRDNFLSVMEDTQWQP